MDDNELNAIRQARMAELQKQQQPDNKITVLSQMLDPSARERLSRVRIVRPDRADAVENYLLKLLQMGGITKKLAEADIVEILNGVARDDQKNHSQIVFNRRETDLDDDDFFD